MGLDQHSGGTTGSQVCGEAPFEASELGAWSPLRVRAGETFPGWEKTGKDDSVVFLHSLSNLVRLEGCQMEQAKEKKHGWNWRELVQRKDGCICN